jgi:hypothetical protein
LKSETTRNIGLRFQIQRKKLKEKPEKQNKNDNIILKFDNSIFHQFIKIISLFGLEFYQSRIFWITSN